MRFARAALAAFLMLRRAADFCLLDAMAASFKKREAAASGEGSVLRELAGARHAGCDIRHEGAEESDGHDGEEGGEHFVGSFCSCVSMEPTLERHPVGREKKATKCGNPGPKRRRRGRPKRAMVVDGRRILRQPRMVTAR